MTQPERPVSNLRLFGFPWWAVGLGVAGLIVIFVVVRNHFKNVSAAASIASTTNPDASASIDTGLVTDQSQYGLPSGPIGSFLAADPQNPAYPIGLTPQGIPGPVTNTQWARLVADQLISKGDDPTLVTNALSKYLNGATLNAQEQAVINLGLTTLGQPPEGVIPVQIITGNTGGPSTSSGGTGTTTPPVPTSTGSPGTRRFVLVTRFPSQYGTLSGIATANHLTLSQLEKLNPQIANPNLIYAGQKVYVS